MAVPSFDDVYQEGRSDGHAEGLAKGRAEGIETGIAKGRAEVFLANLRRLTLKLNMTVEEAMELLEIPQDERAHYAALLKN